MHVGLYYNSGPSCLPLSPSSPPVKQKKAAEPSVWDELSEEADFRSPGRQSLSVPIAAAGVRRGAGQSHPPTPTPSALLPGLGAET